MTKKFSNTLSLVAFAIAASAPSIFAEPESGSIFREYKWRPSGHWQRVTGPDATMSGARQFLPNPVNSISINDLQGATRCEVYIERLQSHAGTMSPRMRVNGNTWLAIPENDPRIVPGPQGSGGRTQEYQTMVYPEVNVPLSQLRQGTNKFEFTCQGKGGSYIGRIWPQWLVYGVTFRIYYAAGKPHPTGAVVHPTPGGILGDNPKFAAVAHSPVGIDRVDFIGNYDDFNWRGNGVDFQWKYHYHYGAIAQHMGTARQAPWQVTWDTTWIPTQPKPFSVVARIVDKNGMVYVTQPLEGLQLRRSKTIVRYKNYGIPKQWSTRAGATHRAKVDIKGDLSKADYARIYIGSWNGVDCNGIGVNGTKLRSGIGKNHDLSYDWMDIPSRWLKQGVNTVWTQSNTSHHGIEVLWPGMEIFVRFNTPEKASAQYVAFGAGCKGSNGKVPQIIGAGRPALGQALTVQVKDVKPWTPVTLLTGGSNRLWGPLPLPLNFSMFGAPNCALLVSPDYARAGLADANGWAGTSFKLPNQSSLVGIQFYNQYVVHDRGVNAAGLVFSNAGCGTIGDF